MRLRNGDSCEPSVFLDGTLMIGSAQGPDGYINSGEAVVLLIPGCHHYTYGSPPPSTDGLRYSGAATVAPSPSDTVRVAVVVTNGSAENRFINFSNCFPVPNAISVSARFGGKEWKSEIWEKRKYPDYYDAKGKELPRVCVNSLAQMILRPEDTYTYSLSVPVSEILGDSLQGGLYRITVRLRINGLDIYRRTPDLELRRHLLTLATQRGMLRRFAREGIGNPRKGEQSGNAAIPLVRSATCN